MGVEVNYLDHSTVIKGWSSLYDSPLLIDMSNCTDSFIALSVILAFKQDKLVHITGIENQKVKECDRPLRVC